MFKISVQSNAYARYDYTLNYTLLNLHELGYDGVEVDCAHMKSTKLWELPTSQRKTLKNSIKDLGIELEALSCHNHILGRGASFTSADPEAKRINMEFNKHVMDTATEFGSKVVTTHVPSPRTKAPKLLPGMPTEWFTKNEQQTIHRWTEAYTQEERELIVQGLGECADYAKDQGVTFAIEVYNPWEFWKSVIKEVASPALGVNLHVSAVWAAMLREKGTITEPSLPQAVEELRDLLVHTHLMDYKLAAEVPPTTWPPAPPSSATMRRHATIEVIPGAGQCDWTAFLKALRDIGYEGYLTIETLRTDIPPEIELAQALRNMKSLLADQD